MTDAATPTIDLLGLTGAWELDAAATTVEFRTKAMWGMAKVVGSLQATSGSADVTPEGGLHGTLVLDAASVDTRQSTRDKHLRSDMFLDVEHHPELVYTATGARSDGGGQVITGTFTARGTTKPLDLEANVTGTEAGPLTISGHTELDRREWGIDTVKLGSGVQITVDVTAVYRRR